MRLALFASLSASLFAAACSDDGHDSARFTTATDVQLRRAIDAARFQDAGLMFEIAGALFGANAPGCPAVSTTGLVTTVTTDCTTENGWALSGKIVITNFGFDTEPARDLSQPSSIEAFDLRATRGNEFQTMDGKVEARLDGPTEDSGFRITASLDLADSSLTAHTDGVMACDAADQCHYEDAWIDVDTLGDATLDPAPFAGDTAKVTLRGQDTLVLDVHRDDQGCFTMTIDGAPRRLCESTLRAAPSVWRSILR
ncbi:MAG: hypothetical protein JNK64_02905 [Myxococcales bacterium]|nr:hypothetical protein [Myxococcales bacterium]